MCYGPSQIRYPRSHDVHGYIYKKTRTCVHLSLSLSLSLSRFLSLSLHTSLRFRRSRQNDPNLLVRLSCYSSRKGVMRSGRAAHHSPHYSSNSVFNEARVTAYQVSGYVRASRDTIHACLSPPRKQTHLYLVMYATASFRWGVYNINTMVSRLSTQPKKTLFMTQNIVWRSMWTFVNIEVVEPGKNCYIFFNAALRFANNFHVLVHYVTRKEKQRFPTKAKWAVWARSDGRPDPADIARVECVKSISISPDVRYIYAYTYTHIYIT